MASQPSYIEQREEQDRQKEAERKIQDAVAPVIQELMALAGDAVSKRSTIEKRWLEDLRQYHGVYEPDVASMLEGEQREDKESRSKLFINITRAKTNAWAARLGDMLFPNDEKNWGINPTPVPELTRSARDLVEEAEGLERKAQALVEQNNAAVEKGEEVDSGAMHAQAEQAATLAKQARDLANRAEEELKVARDRAQAMEREIDDQLTESRYPAICRDVIDDWAKLGTGILKGPIVRSGGRRGWKKIEEAVYQLETAGDRPTFRRVDPWHFFPDPAATCMKEAEYTLERHLPNKKMLRKMARELSFNPEAVRGMLKEGPKASGGGRSSDLGSLVELRNLEGSTESAQTVSLDDRYCVWEFHGTLEVEQIAAMIRAMGRYEDADKFEQDADPLDSQTVRVFFSGTTLLKIDELPLLDSGESLYSVCSFEKAETSVLGGIGVPHMMRHEQSMLNSAVRMLMDNAALSVAPQVVIDKEQVQPQNRSWTLSPRKIWLRVFKAGASLQEKSRPFETYDIPINQQSINAIITLAMQFVDMTVSLPLIAQGEMGEHVTQTKGGMSMLFNSANVVFRRVVKNWDDDITSGVITRAYDFNMQFSDKEEIKGDMKCEARGTAVLLVRELQAEQTLNLIREFATHPILGIAFKPYDALRLVLQAMSINPADVLLDGEDYKQKLAEMAQAEANGEQSPEAIRAQSAIEVANIDAQSRLAMAESNERVAEMRRQTEMMALASKENMTLAQLEARLQQAFGVEKIRTASKERQQAAEIGVEREAARRAEAAGALPAASGGYVSMGARPK